MKRRESSLALVLCALLSSAWLAPAAAEPPEKRSAKPAHKGRARPEGGRKKLRAKPRKERKDDDAPAPSPEQSAERKNGTDSASPGLSAAQKAARDAAQGADAEIVKEGDTSVKVMSFSGLDIEGRLRSPQLLYFVSRVHAEFDRPRLPHRSFMPELDRSTAQEPVR